MTADSIFMLNGGQLSQLRPKPYDAEWLLQKLLADYPEVLAGQTTLGDSDGARLLLVRQEMGVPSQLGGSSTWSLDHLFLDADGVPVIVEVKRSSDSRIRREVVGQMLDYAANGVRYWPIDRLRAALEETMTSQGRSVDEALRELRPDLDPDQFWEQVQSNLKAGRVRMVFVADALPAELITIIEFLNEQMRLADVLGVEVPQYVGDGDGTQVLVPRVYGRTTAATETKSTGGVTWNEDTFLDAATERCSENEVGFLRELLNHAKTKGAGKRLSWGRGASPGVSGWYEVAGQPMAVWNANVNTPAANTRAYAYLYLADLAKRLPAQAMEDLAATLSTIPAYASKIDEARAANWNKYPSIYLPDLATSSAGSATFLASLDKVIAPQGETSVTNGL